MQSRTVVAENLPEDHSHQNLEKIFGVVGRYIYIYIYIYVGSGNLVINSLLVHVFDRCMS
jgi:hypothetical protein